MSLVYQHKNQLDSTIRPLSYTGLQTSQCEPGSEYHRLLHSLRKISRSDLVHNNVYLQR